MPGEPLAKPRHFVDPIICHRTGKFEPSVKNLKFDYVFINLAPNSKIKNLNPTLLMFVTIFVYNCWARLLISPTDNVSAT